VAYRPLLWFAELEITQAGVPKALAVNSGGRALVLLLTEISIHFPEEANPSLIYGMLHVDERGQCRCSLELSIQKTPTEPMLPMLSAPLASFPASIVAGVRHGAIAPGVAAIALPDGTSLSVRADGEIATPFKVRLHGMLAEEEAGLEAGEVLEEIPQAIAGGPAVRVIAKPRDRTST
jgi:hypothetical protein